MKLPGMGEVKNKNVAIGGAVVVGLVAVSYYRKKKAASAAATSATATDASSVDPNAIDPNTGIPYGEEAGYAGGYYTNSSIPNPYVNQGSTIGTGGDTYTTNGAWLSDAEQYASNQFGAAYSLATTALGKYLAQDPKGLQPDEYQLVSEVVATIGQPPVGGPYRLIQGVPVQNPSGGSNPPPEQNPPPQQQTPPPVQIPQPPPPTPTPSPPPQDPNLHYTSNGTISLNTLARFNNSSPQRIIDATKPSEPSDVNNYLRKGSYDAILPPGTKWNIPRN